MNFLSPQWLILFPVLLALGYLFFRENLFRPLRLIILTLLILALILLFGTFDDIGP